MLQNKIQTALQNAKNRGEDEGGFTLIELLVVILIIGILAAIALPTFLGQSDKAKDASAKSDVRNAVSMIEACYSTNESYAPCDTPAALSAAPNNNSGINLVDTPASEADLPEESVAVMAADATTYTLAAKSKTGNVYRIIKGGADPRTCSTAGTGACPDGGNW